MRQSKHPFSAVSSSAPQLTRFRRGQFPSMDTTHDQQFPLAIASTAAAAATTITRIINWIRCDYQCAETQSQFRSSIIAKEDSGG